MTRPQQPEEALFINGFLIGLSGSVFQQMAQRESSPNGCSCPEGNTQVFEPRLFTGSRLSFRCHPLLALPGSFLSFQDLLGTLLVWSA